MNETFLWPNIFRHTMELFFVFNSHISLETNLRRAGIQLSGECESLTMRLTKEAIIKRLTYEVIYSDVNDYRY